MDISRRVPLLMFLALAAPARAAEAPWYRAPTLAIMTGFIYEPLKPYTIHEWAKGLGSRFDADRWVADFKAAGASYLIFYDKWIDGFVFHDTKTTGFKTRRDFVRELADACHRGGLRLVLYFNAISDGNPEFKKWATHDRSGRPIVFGLRWPTGYQTLHSPFRQVSVAQVRELLTNYGRIDGLWLDIFGERLNTSSEWVARGYEKMYGTPFGKATGATLAEFNARTLAGYLDEVRAIAAKHQPDCVWTANGSGGHMLAAGVWGKWVGARLDYGSAEGRSLGRDDQLARMAWASPKPLEIGLLINSSWFCPIKDTPPPAGKTPKQAIAATAIAMCQGASIYLAMTPGHSGLFGDDLKVAKAVGAWFRATEPVLRDAQPYADVGIVPGSPAQAAAMSGALARAGVFSRLLRGRGAGSEPSPNDYRAIVLPEQAALSKQSIEQLRQYVKQGGRLVAFAHASMLDESGKRREHYALGGIFGARYKGEVTFPAAVRQTLVKVDSEYSPQFVGRHLVDGRPTAWASGGTPMPHWAEILLPETVEVAKIELVSRQGPYLVADIDIEAHDGKTWRLIKSVRGAKTRLISAPLKAPVRTRQIRVKILRELYQGQDRQYADVEASRVFDAAGRDRSTNRAATATLVAAAPDAERAFGSKLPSFLPMAVGVEPTTAEVLARLNDKNRSPAILRNRHGRGEAILITVPEAALRGSESFWTGLRRLVLGKPTLVCKEAARYRIIPTRVAGKHVLHVIDRHAARPKYAADDVTISLEAERFGGARAATLVGATAPLKTTRDGGRMVFSLRPDPVASVLLR